MSEKYGINERKQAWTDFMDMKKPVRHVYLVGLDGEMEKRPEPWPSKKKERIEWAWVKYNRMMDRLDWLPDDSIPFLDVYTGTEIFAEAFGCSIHRAEDSMPFALAAAHNASEAAKIKVPDLWSSPLALLFEIADALRDRAGKDTILRLPDIQSPMDISALIWDKNDFYIALLEEPEAVKELASKVQQLLLAFCDEWFRRYGKEYIAHYPDYYMTGGITLSEDEIGIVNEEMFIALFLPELTEISNHFGGLGMHCCAHAVHQWENLKKVPNLRMLNLVQPEKTLQNAYEFFATHVPQMHSWCGDSPAAAWPGSYPPGAHVVLQAAAANRDEAQQLAEALWKGCGRS